tara:strand:+ start:440 stop:730 length:291 start_codon:yes stop_codon:yes gene_type:complete
MMDNKLILLAWFLLAHLGNIADTCLTLFAVTHGAEELNPLMAMLLSFSPFAFAATKLVVFAFAIDFVARTRPFMLRWIAVLYMLVAAWHLSFIFTL